MTNYSPSKAEMQDLEQGCAYGYGGSCRSVKGSQTTQENGMTDRDILKIVDKVLSRALRQGDNWADRLDLALTNAGVDLADSQPDGSDPDEIVRLDDNRSVWFCDASAVGSWQYRIIDDKVTK